MKFKYQIKIYMSIEIEENLESDFIKITDEDIAYALVEEAKTKAIILMKKDLNNYIKCMGKEASFKGWVAHICPENIIVDKRLEMPGSAWHYLWDTESSLYDIIPKVNKNQRLTKKQNHKISHTRYSRKIHK